MEGITWSRIPGLTMVLIRFSFSLVSYFIANDPFLAADICNLSNCCSLIFTASLKPDSSPIIVL
jgi:hypothetical protein